jgi:hypothetical protein
MQGPRAEFLIDEQIQRHACLRVLNRLGCPVMKDRIRGHRRGHLDDKYDGGPFFLGGNRVRMDEDDVRDIEAARFVGEFPLIILVHRPVHRDLAGVEGALSAVGDAADDLPVLNAGRVHDEQDSLVHVLDPGGLEQTVGQGPQVLRIEVVELKCRLAHLPAHLLWLSVPGLLILGPERSEHGKVAG